MNRRRRIRRMTTNRRGQAPKKAASQPAKHPRAKASGSDAGASGEASAKKAKTTKPPPLDSKKVEHERLKLLANAGKRITPPYSRRHVSIRDHHSASV
jgi:hypothetical protein